MWHRSQVDHTLGSTYAWDDGTGGQRQHFREDVTYDPNGNILTYRRVGANSANMLMDNLAYHYGSDDNRLLYIDDAQTNQSAYVGDLEDQADDFARYLMAKMDKIVRLPESGMLLV